MFGRVRAGERWRPGESQAFTEDAEQGEDGLNLEKELWGARIRPLPGAGEMDPSAIPAPVVATFDWPGCHSQPYQQGLTPSDQLDAPYFRWLTSPSSPSWTVHFAVPVAWYAKYLQKCWWQFSHRKWASQGLKLADEGPAPPSILLRRFALPFNSVNDQDDLDLVLGGSDGYLYIWVMNVALPQLWSRKHRLISRYLVSLMRQAGEVQILGTRFKNEVRAWDHKQQQLERLARAVQTDYQAMIDFMNTQSPVSAQAPPLTTADVLTGLQQANNAVLPVLRSMAELDRVLNQVGSIFMPSLTLIEHHLTKTRRRR